MGRPISWPDKIIAAPEVVDFYRALAIAVSKGAFADCHVYSGARSAHGTPKIVDPVTKKLLPGASIIAQYMGMDVSGRRRCGTEGCINPFHYAKQDEAKELFPSQLPSDIDQPFDPRDFIDLVRYHMDSHKKKTVTLQWLRHQIPPEDLSVEMLKTIFNILPAEWKEA